MIDNKNIIDFQKINKKIKSGEVLFVKETLNSVIDRFELGGFFAWQTSYDPHGIVLDYDIEEVKKEIDNA